MLASPTNNPAGEHRSLPAPSLAIMASARHATAGWAAGDSRQERHEEEFVNLVTHAGGLVLALAGSGVLLAGVAGSHDLRTTAGVAVYAASLVACYAASTLSHLFHRPRLRHVFRMLDQVCIFLLIAGTSTPFALEFFAGRAGLLMAGTTWTLALVGIAFKLGFRRGQNVATWCFVGLGWLPVVALPDLLASVPAGALALIVGGGAVYTIGTAFLHLDRRVRYFHAVWHVLVIAASGLHWLAVWRYVV